MLNNHQKQGTMQEEELYNNQSEQIPEGETSTDQSVSDTEEGILLTEEEKLSRQLAQANLLIDEQKDKYLRLSAEFDNYRKRTIKEKAELILNGGEKTIHSILPITDDMERALKMPGMSDIAPAIQEGMELIYNKFIATLEQNGVKIIETQGKALDTDFHEAIATIPAPSENLKGKIVECVQTGYTLNGKVIRHAKVVMGE